MNFKSIKNIIFDLGNVIINIDFDLTFKAFQKLTDKPLELVYQKFSELQLWERYETGEISNSEFLAIVRNTLELKCSDNKIINAWNALLLDIPQQRIKLLEELAVQYKLYFLSNTSDYHIEDVNRILSECSKYKDLKELVCHAYYSHEMQLRKPDPAIYNKVLELEGLNANETIFLDDNKDNVISAEKVGIKSFLVTPENDINNLLAKAL